jgi:hypothetical protein
MGPRASENLTKMWFNYCAALIILKCLAGCDALCKFGESNSSVGSHGLKAKSHILAVPVLFWRTVLDPSLAKNESLTLKHEVATGHHYYHRIGHSQWYTIIQMKVKHIVPDKTDAEKPWKFHQQLIFILWFLHLCFWLGHPSSGGVWLLVNQEGKGTSFIYSYHLDISDSSAFKQTDRSGFDYWLGLLILIIRRKRQH